MRFQQDVDIVFGSRIVVPEQVGFDEPLTDLFEKCFLGFAVCGA